MVALSFDIIGKDISGSTALTKIGISIDKLSAQFDKFKGKDIFIKATVDDEGAITKMQALQAEAEKTQTKLGATGSEAKNFGSGMLVAGAAVAAVSAVIVGKGLVAAAQFQQQLTRLVTSAGESQSAIAKVSAGILDLAAKTGTSTTELTAGMYQIDSAGYTLAKGGLLVLQAAAEGAKTENASLGTVANAVTDILTDYKLKASDAATVTSKLVETTAQGKTTFQDLAGAMSSIAPIASAAHIKLDDMLGDLAEMTTHGVSAEQASQNLANSVRSLSNPTKVMTNELAQFGIDSSQVSQQLGSRGLSGTLEMVASTILDKMGPSGQVLLNSYNQSKIAARDAQQAFSALPPALQKVATEYKNGSISSRDWTLGLKDMSAPQANILKQWANLQNSSQGFSTALKSGSSTAQSFTQAMAKATGNSTSLQVALMITGQNADATKLKIQNIANATTEAGGHVKGWAEIQQTLNQKLAESKESFNAMTIGIGQGLLPIVTKIVGGFGSFFGMLATHAGAVKTFLLLAGGLGVIFALSALGVKAYTGSLQLAKAAQLAYGVVTKGTTAAIAAQDTATEASPIVLTVTLIAAAVAALVIGIVELVKHWSQVWGAIKSVTSAFVGWLKSVFGPVASWFGSIWDSIKVEFDAFVSFWRGVWAAFMSVVSVAVNWFKSNVLPKIMPIITAAVGAAKAFGNAFSAAFNLVVIVVKWFAELFIAIAKPVFGWLVSRTEEAIGQWVGAFKLGASIVVGIWTVVWNIIKGIIKVAWDIIKPILKIGLAFLIADLVGFAAFFKGAWLALWGLLGSILKGAWQIISGVLIGVFNLLKNIFQAFADLFRGRWGALWNDVKGIFSSLISIIVSILRGAATILSGILTAFVKFVVAIFSGIKATAVKLWQDLWGAIGGFAERIWHDVTSWFSNLWTDAKAIFNLMWSDEITIFKNIYNSVTGWAKNIWHDVVAFFKNLWNDVTGFAKSIWQDEEKGWKNIYDAVTGWAKNVWHDVVQAFTNMKNDLLNVFKAIANTVFVTPINFIINTVIDKGINSLIHGVGDVFGQNWGVHVNPVTPFATGGVVPGVGNRDTVPALLMPGEVVVDKARVRAAGGPAAFGYGPKANTRARMTSGGIPAYGLGDVIGNIGTAIGAGVRTAIGGAAPGVSNVIGHAVTWARGTLANTAKGVLNSTIYPLADSVSKSGIFGQVPHDIAHKIGDTLVTWIAGKDSSAAGAPIGYKPSAGVAQWDSTIISVLQALGQPVSWLQTIEHRMNQESGGNPNAINLTDSNAKAGDPSRGLMQTIMSTFLAYAPKGATAADIYMPYDNIYAGTNYAIHRYGSIAGMNRPGGYANGAIFNRPTLGVMGESGDELLLPLQRRGRVKQLLNRAGLSSPQSGTTHKHYNLTVNANEFSAADLRKAFKQLQALDGGSA